MSTDAWKTFADAASELDPEATVTAAVYAATVHASGTRPATDPPPLPAVTLPELPLLSVGWEERAGAPGPGEGDADFEVTGVLGEGGMGRVLLARQRSLRRDVAIKVVRPEQVSPAGVGTLLVEAVITGSVDHPGVIPVHLLGRDAMGHPVLVMKRVEGVSWRALAEDPGHPLWSVIAPDAGDRLDAHLEILLAVCSAAHAAHARGFVHRDIKLDNVMIGSFGEVYLVDWGIALRAEDGAHGQKLICGTPSYMAPEMVRGHRIDARTDVYLLGATLHAVLLGAPRHRGSTLVEVLTSARDAVPFVYGPEVPAELAALLGRAMAASPAERFPSALDLRHALASFRRHRDSINLCEKAAEALAALPPGDAPGAHAVLTECRFGFTAALRAWPESPAARAGLERCLLRMIDHEILQRDAGGARALLAELPGDHPDLVRRVEALEADLRAAAGREAALAKMERDRDLTIGGRAQLAVVGILPVLATGVLVYVHRNGGRPIPSTELVGVPAVVFAILLAAILASRRRLDTAISRKAVGLLLLVLASVVVHRALLTLLHAPQAAIVAGDLVLGTAVGAAAAVTMVPRLVYGLPVILTGAVAIVLSPGLAVPIFSVTVVGALSTLVFLWWLAVRKPR